LNYVNESLKKDISFFNINEIQYNVTKHVLVPKHERITTEEEKAAIKKSLQLGSLLQLPLIHISDPVVRAIGGQINDIIKITRHSADGGEHIVYRYCIFPDHH
jgi:DNA-directed RNA polymerase I, II, and III subunit RPABC1